MLSMEIVEENEAWEYSCSEEEEEEMQTHDEEDDEEELPETNTSVGEATAVDLSSSDTKSIMKEFACTWPGCTKSYNKKSNLKRHVLQQHEEHRPFACPQCNQTFKMKQHLNRHVRGHAIPRPYLCSFENCTEAFKKKSHLQRHESYVHKNTKPYPCPHPGCNLSFHWPSRVQRHINTSHSRKSTDESQEASSSEQAAKTAQSLRCGKCSKKFRSARTLAQHQDVHKLDRQEFYCPYPDCIRSFTRKSNLSAHIKFVHEKKTQLYNCTICQTSFEKRSLLKKHKKEEHATSETVAQEAPEPIPRNRRRTNVISLLGGVSSLPHSE